MKNKVLFLLMVVFVAISVSFYAAKDKKGNCANFSLINAEALANTEYSNIKCFGSGSIDCPINQVKVLYYY